MTPQFVYKDRTKVSNEDVIQFGNEITAAGPLLPPRMTRVSAPTQKNDSVGSTAPHAGRLKVVGPPRAQLYTAPDPNAAQGMVKRVVSCTGSGLPHLLGLEACIGSKRWVSMSTNAKPISRCAPSRQHSICFWPDA